MSIILNAPPLVRQSTNMTCWAASFVAWCRASGISEGSGAASESAIVNNIAPMRGTVGSDGGATEGGIITVARYGFMNIRTVRGASLTAEFFERTLRQQGHIYLAYRPLAPGIPGGHVVVVYGINDRQQLLVMDPDPSVLFPCHAPVNWYQGKSMAHVCTSIIGRREFVNPF